METEGGDALINSLRSGSITQVTLQLGSGTNLEELQTAIEANTTLGDVELIFSHSFSQRTRQEVARAGRFIELISRRPNLQQLKLTSEGDLGYYALPIAVLSSILDLATGLQKIELGLIELAGEVEDFTALEQSMLNHSSLIEISCTCWLSEETRMRLSLDPLIKALAASRSVQSINFQPAFTFGGLTSASVGMLCTLPTLRRLNLAKLNLTDDNVVAMAESLRENTQLTELRLSCRLLRAGTVAMANCLKDNAKLEVLIIHNTSTNADSDSTDSSDVHNNSTTSSSSDNRESNEDHRAQIPQALQANQTLKHFALHGTKLSLTTQTSFVEMLKQNYTLESLSLVDLGGDLKDEMEMYTLLNRCGRARLFEAGGNGREQWVDTMALVSDDLDCLFYCLSTKPSLCDLLYPDEDDDDGDDQQEEEEKEDDDDDIKKRGQGGSTDQAEASKRPKTS